MLDRWFYTLAGKTYGPVTAAHIHSLAAEGKLPAAEQVWPEGFDVQISVDDFTAMQRAGTLPDWLDDVRQAEAAKIQTRNQTPLPNWMSEVEGAEKLESSKPAVELPSWLDDVRQAERAKPAPAQPQAAAVPPTRSPAAPAKPQAAAAVSFVEALQQHQLLRKEQLDEVTRDLIGRFPADRELAQELIRKNWLTAYQAKFVLANRAAQLAVGSYRIMERLGAGGMGVVFKAWHTRMDRIVALKIIAKDRLSNPRSIERFFREVRAASQLQHPNIALAYDADQAGDMHYFAMEYVSGIDLKRLVKHDGPRPLPEACDFARQAARGLQHAHERGIVHRDIKPGNLLLSQAHGSQSGGLGIIKILDFGLARLEDDADPAAQLTSDNTVLGTVDYIAPEQAARASTVDTRADIYSLGCTLFYLLTDHVPYEGGTALQRISARVLNDAPPASVHRPEVPAALDRVLAKMLARQPADRYQTPAEVDQALEPF